MNWFRSHHGISTDPKWSLISRRAKTTTANVVAVFLSLLDHASQQEDRGSVAGWDTEVAAMFLGIEEDDIHAILQAMRDKGVLTGERVTNWHKRQPKREREDDSTERVREYRERRKQTAEDGVSAVTAPRNAVKRHVTPCNAQIDREIERETTTPKPPTSSEPDADVVASEADAADPGGTPESALRLPADILKRLEDKPPHWHDALRDCLLGADIKSSPTRYLLRILQGWEAGDNPPKPPPPPPRPAGSLKPAPVAIPAVVAVRADLAPEAV